MKHHKIDRLNEPHQKGDLKIYSDFIVIYTSTKSSSWNRNQWLKTINSLNNFRINFGSDSPTFNFHDYTTAEIQLFRKSNK